MGWRLLVLVWLVEETAGFGSLQYLKSNQLLTGNPLTVAPAPGLDDASLFHHGAPAGTLGMVGGSARVGATPYWSLDDPGMGHTGMNEVFQKRSACSSSPSRRSFSLLPVPPQTFVLPPTIVASPTGLRPVPKPHYPHQPLATLYHSNIHPHHPSPPPLPHTTTH